MTLRTVLVIGVVTMIGWLVWRERAEQAASYPTHWTKAEYTCPNLTPFWIASETPCEPTVPVAAPAMLASSPPPSVRELTDDDRAAALWQRIRRRSEAP